ncbi:DNA methyltransferase [Caldibacillus thermoamylovorans]|uniref:DNA methyltransferase n=1 Tax=Caldibacillus thermoamylovorans TaxID=35841 RepID=UPI00204194D0|nr:DNA methyltransferase [Caldibacillus thermoamylovorans]MCM3053886.1 site-specific DNA-methyltransferase [Caldibacillus thermoamylovorans]
MTDNQKKLMNILREMFQFDQADLDFGIYRIMRMKRDEINRFIEDELPAQITVGLSELAALDTSAGIAEIDRQIAETKSGTLPEAIKAAAIAAYEEQKKSLAGSVDITAVEADVYNHLTNFFSRYYDDGDFISQRRYKEGVYAIPYEGEEVKLHWANADQYYVKTSEYFKDYTFKTMYGETVHFKLIEAETEMDNNKAKEKRFFQLYTEKPFEVIDGELFIYVEYKASEYSGKTAQARHITDIVDAFAAVQTQPEYLPFAAIMTVTDNKTLLERHLNRYTARNTYDYFIHKDLGKFLRRELDFYIKNEVIYLDDIDEQDEAKTKEYLTKAKVIRKIARKIITFLAQIEDFQKKLFLKKKFVVETNYCITLDRVPESMYPEIAANDAQREEWVCLFAIDEITGDDMFTVPYSVPLTVEFLKQNPFLVLDTAFFSTEFKEQLVASIDNLDEKLDGLLIHSENFQAIRLLQQKYQNKVKCIYIDPPYNAKSSEILYKNTFKHSSWLSLIENRLSAASYLLKEDSVITIAIDEVEQTRLGELLRVIFPSKQITAITVVHNPSGQQGDNFSFTNEFAYFVYSDLKNVIGQEIRDESGIDVRTFRDNSGNNNLRTDAANCFYPIYVRNNEIIGFGDVSPDDYHPESRCIKIDENTIAVYPIDNNGVEKKWVFERGTVEGIRDQLWVKGDVQQGDIDIMRSKSVFRYKTTWTDKKYSANSYGSALLTAMNIPFDYPKSIYTVIDCVKAGLSDKDSGIVFDFFAGSGTTGHAIIRLNNEDKGARKYILAEMGNHFDTATKPRVIKAIYSDDYNGVAGWKKGKPISRRGNSHAFKYIRLESYEDTLNNIVLSGGNYDLLGAAREDYILSYMLNTESSGSASLLNVEKLDKPFSYKMLIARNLESKERNIDLVETFNYLIGLTVIKSHALVSYDADFSTGDYGAVTASLKAGSTYKFKTIEGTTPNGDKTLVIWREMTGDIEKDNAALDAYFLTIPNARSFKRIYVNCDNNLLNLRNKGESWQVVLIDEEMKKRMFENAE